MKLAAIAAPRGWPLPPVAQAAPQDFGLPRGCAVADLMSSLKSCFRDAVLAADFIQQPKCAKWCLKNEKCGTCSQIR